MSPKRKLPDEVEFKADGLPMFESESVPADWSPEKDKETTPTSNKRRSVACKACHALKVRCVPLNEKDPNGPCTRCTKAKRPCEIDFTQIKRKRTTTPHTGASKVANLEREIKNLKAELSRYKNTRSSSVPAQSAAYSIIGNSPHCIPAGAAPSPELVVHSSPSVISSNGSIHHSPHRTVPTPPQPSGLKTENSAEPKSFMASLSSIEETHTFDDKTSQIDELKKELDVLVDLQSVVSNSNGTALSKAEERLSILAESYRIENNDPISLGLLTLQQAEERLNVFRSQMAGRYPFVTVEPNMSADELRKQQPVLFLTIMSTSSMLTNSSNEVNARLEVMVMRVISMEVITIGNKSLELLKSLLIISIWYNSPELFHHRRYHMISVLCIAMIQDLGLSGRPFFVFNKEEGTVRKAVMDDPKALECRSLVLVVYLTSVCISLFLRRKIPAQWTDYMEDCCLELEMTGSRPGMTIALYARLNCILEKSHMAVHSPLDASVSISELDGNRHKYVVGELQRQLDGTKKKIILQTKGTSEYDAFMAYFYSVQAYLHEPALHKIFNEGKFHESPDQPLPAFVGISIERCAQSCFDCLYHFCELSETDVTTMPLFYSSRIIYTAGMLLRLRYLCVCVPAIAKYNIVTTDSLIVVKRLCELVCRAATSHPGNNFLSKMRLVLGLFTQTYLSQIQSIISISEQEQRRDKLSPPSWNNNNNNGATQNPASPLDILSDAAAMQGPDSRPQSQEVPSIVVDNNGPMNLDSTIYGSKTRRNSIFDKAYMGVSPKVDPVENDPVELSYWALNDEFWSDLLMSMDTNQDPGFNLAGQQYDGNVM